MIRKLFPSFLIAIMMGFTVCPLALKAENTLTPPQVLVAPEEQSVSDDPYFQWIVEKQASGLSPESAKIEYLIERIRHSQYNFIRNNVPYDATHAAEHLSWKYGLARKRIKTADDFIQLVATKSIESGLPYLVKLPDGKTYATGDVLTNELHRLESLLQKSR